MFRRIIVLVLLLGAGFGMSGCATKALVDRATTGETIHRTAATLTEAWIGQDGELTGCISGWYGTRGKDLREFGFTVPLMQLGPDQFASVGVKLHIIPSARIKTGCPGRPPDADAIPVKHADYRRTGPTADRGWTAGLFAHIDEGRAGRTLYSIENYQDDGGAALVYQHDAPLPTGSRLLRIELSNEYVEGNPAYLLGIPFTAVFDLLYLIPLAILDDSL